VKQYHKNPRQITKKQFAKLEESIKELGDLGGIVHDLNSDEIIGGNMRSRVFDIDTCEVEIVTTNDQPDEQGTVAHGFVIWQGKRHAYRQVRWTPQQCERANLAANNIGGTWEWQELSGWDKSTLEWAGFDGDALRQWNLNALNLREMIESDGAQDPNKEWEGMPEFENKDMSAFKSIHVNFTCQADYDAFAELIGQKLTEKTRSIWYPVAEKINMRDVYNES
jgi:hypothetical protein